jgi:peptidase E
MKKNACRDICLLAGNPRARRQDPMIARAVGSVGVESPSIAYVGTASGDNRLFFAWIRRALRGAGAGQVTLAPLCGRKADPEKAKRVMEASDSVFVSGGDVEAGMEALQSAGVIPFMEGLFRSGKHFFGVSAGSIMLASEWVRWRDPDDDSTAGRFPCLGFAPVRCDTHAEEDNWEELKALLSLAGHGADGYGIPAGGMIRVSAEGAVEDVAGTAVRYVNRKGIVGIYGGK